MSIRGRAMSFRAAARIVAFHGPDAFTTLNLPHHLR